MSDFRIHLFGKFTVECTEHQVRGLASHKVQELLSYLLIHHGHPQLRESLSEILWENQPPYKSKKNLRQTLWRLQSSLDGFCGNATSLLRVDEEWVQVNENFAQLVDCIEMEKTYNRFNDIRARDLCPEDFKLIQNSIALYCGELLEGWYQDWCIFERERFQSMYITLLNKLIQYCEINHLYDSGIAYCAEVLRSDRAYERAHRQMMRLYYMSGDRSQALRQYIRCESALQEELGVEPSERTKQLYEQIREDKFIPPASNQVRIKPASKNADPPLSDILARLLDFSQTLDHIQLQIRREILNIEQSIQPGR